MVMWFFILSLAQIVPGKSSLGSGIKLNRTKAASEFRFSSDESPDNMEFQWNPASESWINFHIRICGAFCNGTEYIELGEIPYPICNGACFPCDCDITCPIYGTCCPSIDPNTPLSEKDRKQYKYSEDYAPVFFVGSLMDYDFIDKNSYTDFVVDNPDLGIDSNFSGKFSCLTTSWVDGNTEQYYAIDNCPDEMKNETVGKLCEMEDLDIMTLESATPVIDMRNGIVFKNKYCLRCNVYNKSENDHLAISDTSVPNGETPLDFPYQKWDLGIFCTHYQQFYMLESSNAFLRAIFRDVTENPKSPCLFRFEPPRSRFSPRICRQMLTEETPVGKVYPTSDCIHDSGVFRNIRHFCHSLTAEAYRVYQRQNVFCYMCVYDFPNCFTPRWTHEKYVTNHLSFLLGQPSAIKTNAVPERQEEEGYYLCEGSQEWMDEKDNCQNPECVKGKQLKDGTCECIVKLIQSLGYKVTAFLRPLQDMKEEYADQFENHLITNFFTLTNTSGSLDLSMAVFGRKDSDRENLIEYVFLSGHLISGPGIPRDDFENNFLNHSFKFHVQSNNSNSDGQIILNLSAVYIGADMLRFLRLGTKQPNHPIRRGYGKSSKKQAPEGSRIGHQHDKSVLKRVIRQKLETATIDLPIGRSVGVGALRWKRGTTVVNYGNFETTFSGNKLYPDSIWTLTDSFIDLTHSLVCPYVSFDIERIRATPKRSEIFVDFKYRAKNYSLNVASSQFSDSVTIINGKIRICIDKFRNEYQHIQDHHVANSTFTISVTEMAKRYFALGCFLLSAICLALTIASYALFPELRTLAGLNTLMLSISLAIAQIFSVVVVEIVGFIHGWLCMGLGMGLHFSWLVACQWMSVCCFHMFSVFRGHQARSSPTGVKRKFELYCFYVYGSSAVTVCLTIIASEIFSQSKTTGYSKDLCIFDSEWSYLVAVLSFVLPLGLISVSNLVMFLVTVREIMSVTSLQMTGRMKGKDGVATYFKLSSLTGIFWILTILATMLNNPVLDFISIPFVALQGVFIFFSFTVNANTKNLMSQMRGRSHAPKTSNSPAGTRVSLITDEDETGKSSTAHV